jgi:hypothetical protein
MSVKGDKSRVRDLKAYNETMDSLFPRTQYGIFNVTTQHWVKDEDGSIVLGTSEHRMQLEMNRLLNFKNHELRVKKYEL